MIKVLITSRNFTLGSKAYGKGGTYPVDEKTARWIIRENKGRVVEGILSDEDDLEIKDISNAQFLAMVKRNALAIVTIIEDAVNAKIEEIANPSIIDPAIVEMTADLTVEKAINDSEDVLTQPSGELLSEPETSKEINEEVISSETIELPENFPGREILIAAGVTNINNIPDKKEKLMELEGMTARLANQIGVKLSQKVT